MERLRRCRYRTTTRQRRIRIAALAATPNREPTMKTPSEETVRRLNASKKPKVKKAPNNSERTKKIIHYGTTTKFVLTKEHHQSILARKQLLDILSLHHAITRLTPSRLMNEVDVEDDESLHEKVTELYCDLRVRVAADVLLLHMMDCRTLVDLSTYERFILSCPSFATFVKGYMPESMRRDPSSPKCHYQLMLSSISEALAAQARNSRDGDEEETEEEDPGLRGMS